ncbi:hypothetical protein BV22DRAFT_1179250 [Leucogyrophana mollusca]|uniref:Uncharacterized protein n=1 Tax=Leucogyrophana mollusca TaxID=85980 RepID=A0ACB8B5K2_9AGAM|nr:hypothetical protein BV22DRAFT_1179250 [Leucogyrophana mollusca]
MSKMLLFAFEHRDFRAITDSDQSPVKTPRFFGSLLPRPLLPFRTSPSTSPPANSPRREVKVANVTREGRGHREEASSATPSLVPATPTLSSPAPLRWPAGHPSGDCASSRACTSRWAQARRPCAGTSPWGHPGV